MPTQSISDKIAVLKDIFGNPTGFGDRVKEILDEAFGANNEFGSAALLDVGTSENNIPELVGTTLPPSVLPVASDTQYGMVTVADNLTNPPAGSVAQAADINELVELKNEGIDASSISMPQIFFSSVSGNSLRVTASFPAGIGFIIASGGGGGGGTGRYNSFGDTNQGLSGASGSPFLIAPTSSLTSQTGVIEVSGGQGTASGNSSTFSSTQREDGIVELSDEMLQSNGLLFGIIEKGGGARGGCGAHPSVSPHDASYFTEVFGPAGGNADLLVAVKAEPAIRIYSVKDSIFNRPDTNGGAGGGLAENGRKGFIYFIKLT